MSYEKSTTRFHPIVGWLTGISIGGAIIIPTTYALLFNHPENPNNQIFIAQMRTADNLLIICKNEFSFPSFLRSISFLQLLKNTYPLFFVFHIFTMSIREGCNSFVPTLEIGKLRLKVVFFPKGPNTKISSLTNAFQLKRYNKKHHFCWRPTLIFGQRNMSSDFFWGEARGHYITNLNNALLFGEIPENYNIFALFDPHSNWVPLNDPCKNGSDKRPGKTLAKRPPTLQQPLCQTGQPLCQMAKEMMGWWGQQEPNHRCLSAYVKKHRYFEYAGYNFLAKKISLSIIPTGMHIIYVLICKYLNVYAKKPNTVLPSPWSGNPQSPSTTWCSHIGHMWIWS